MTTDAPPLTADRPPFPSDWNAAEPSFDVADLGLHPDVEAELRGDHA